MRPTERVLNDLHWERINQREKWGEQHHPNGTSRQFGELADIKRQQTDNADRLGILTWKDILDEEIYEAYAEVELEALRHELVQVAAVVVAWIEDIDSRESLQ